MRHSIEIIANVDDQQVHRVKMDVSGDMAGTIGLPDFDPATAVVRALRQEADLIEQEAEDDGRRRLYAADHTVIDAVEPDEA